MVRSGLLLLHAPITHSAGDPGTLRFEADQLERDIRRCEAIFAERTKLTKATLRGWFDSGADHYFDSTDALKAGLVDEVYDPQEMPAIAP